MRPDPLGLMTWISALPWRSEVKAILSPGAAAGEAAGGGAGPGPRARAPQVDPAPGGPPASPQPATRTVTRARTIADAMLEMRTERSRGSEKGTTTEAAATTGGHNPEGTGHSRPRGG